MEEDKATTDKLRAIDAKIAWGDVSDPNHPVWPNGALMVATEYTILSGKLYYGG